MIQPKRILIAMAAAAFLFGVVTALVSAPADRFDNQIRTKFFAGFAGHQVALDEAMKTCEQILAENPNHAEAMVWYGTGMLFEASLAFRRGDMEKGSERLKSSIATMDKAVAVAPDSVAVRVPRGAALLAASRVMPADMGTPLLERALDDYERVLALQAGHFHTLGEHPRGELLFGLAEGWSRAGDTAKATAYFERILKDLAETEYAKRARKWLDTRQLVNAERGCIGCHVSK